MLINANIGTSVLGEFSFTLSYPNQLLSFNEAIAADPETNLIYENGGLGTMIIRGTNSAGIPGSTVLPLAIVTLTPISAGTGNISISVQTLNDINGSSLGTGNGTGSTVTINDPGTVSPTGVPTSAPTPVDVSAAAVWLFPASQSVNGGSSFTIEIHANTGSAMLGAFGFTVTYPSNMIAYSSIAEITSGLNLVSNTTEPGKIVVAGFSIAGVSRARIFRSFESHSQPCMEAPHPSDLRFKTLTM